MGDAIGKERAPTIGVLIAARAVQSAGGAVFPLAYGIIRDRFTPGWVAAAIGGISAVIAAGGGLGIVLAGPIVDAPGLAWLFWIPLIMSAATAVAAYLVIPRPAVRQSAPLSWLTAALLSAWLIALLLAVSRGPAWGWDSPATVSACSRPRRHAGGLGRGGTPNHRPADRPAPHASTGRLDHEPRRAAVRRRTVRDLRLRAAVPPDGLRWGELVGLETGFVRPELIRVEWQLWEDDAGAFHRLPPKDDSYRDVDVPSGCRT